MHDDEELKRTQREVFGVINMILEGDTVPDARKKRSRGGVCTLSKI